MAWWWVWMAVAIKPRQSVYQPEHVQYADPAGCTGASWNQDRPKNVAAVMVTASLPPFSSLVRMWMLRCLRLAMPEPARWHAADDPLKGADGQVYAMAQGNVVIAGAGAQAGGSKAQIKPAQCRSGAGRR